MVMVSFYDVHGHFNSHSMGSLVLYTWIYVEKWTQCFTVYWYQYRYWVLVSTGPNNIGCCV